MNASMDKNSKVFHPPSTLDHVYVPSSRHNGETIPVSIIDWLHKSSIVNAAETLPLTRHRRLRRFPF